MQEWFFDPYLFGKQTDLCERGINVKNHKPKPMYLICFYVIADFTEWWTILLA